MPEPKPPPMSHPVGVLHDIRWNEICPWLILVRSLRVALLVRVLLLAWAGVLLTQLGWSAVDRFFLEDSVSEDLAFAPWAPLERMTERFPSGSILDFSDRPWQRENPLTRAWKWLSQPFIRIATGQAPWRHGLALLCSATWSIAIWALFGGAISRIAALHLTRGETLGMGGALRASATAMSGTVGAPLIALAATAGLCVPLALAGALIRLDSMALIVGLAWGLILIFGLMLAVVLIGLFLGWPLMWATLAVERSDAFDAVSRCYAYVYQRPLHLAFYLLVGAFLGVLGELVVDCFVTTSVHLAEWAVSWGAGAPRTAELATRTPAEIVSSEGGAAVSLTGIALTGAKAIHCWKWAWMAVAASYPVAYLWSAAVGIYLLLRRQVDSTEMTEVKLTQGEPFQGLPDLTNNAAGLPQVQRTS